MLDGWGSTGPPEENFRLPLMDKIKSLILQDEALARGSQAVGFTQRQVSLGFRQSVKLQKPPEVNVGKLMDIGS